MTLDPGNLFHVGFVVADLDAAMAEMSRTMGVTWGPRLDVELPLWTPWEVRIATTHSVYSREFPHLELETEVPGTVFTVSDRPLHHIGYWTDDLTGESAALEEQGMPLVAGAEVGGSLYGMAFHRTSTGLYIELVDRARFPDWEGFLCGRGAVDRIVDDGPVVAGAGQQRVLDPSR